jgi:putative membrane protein
MSLMMVGAWALLILLVVWLVRPLRLGTRGGEEAPRGPTALEILEERFARGEIDRQEFEERRTVLSGRASLT